VGLSGAEPVYTTPAKSPATSLSSPPTFLPALAAGVFRIRSADEEIPRNVANCVRRLPEMGREVVLPGPVPEIKFKAETGTASRIRPPLWQKGTAREHSSYLRLFVV